MFYDRLVDNDDREKFFNIVKERTSAYFKQSIDKVMFIIVFKNIFLNYLYKLIAHKKTHKKFTL